MISIIVCSYNSEKTILETLKSIENQTYTDFEVIITDDASIDNTISIAKNWKSESDFKERIIILESKSNIGTVKNINKGIKASKGKWIKIIAADDLLVKDCLQENMNYVERYDISILTSKAQYFNSSGDLKRVSPLKKDMKFFSLSAKQQYKKLLRSFYVCSVSSFIRKDFLIKINLFDEKIPLIEDYPFYLKATKMGEKISFMPKITVKYRVGESISNTQKNIINLKFYTSKKLVYLYYLKKNLPFYLKMHYIYEFFIYDTAIKIFNNENTQKSKYYINFLKIFDILFIFNKIKSLF